MMCPEDMARLSLQRGDRVTVRSPHGTMHGVAVEPFDLPAGNLMAYFPEANVLTGTSVDPRSKTPSFKATPVSVERTLTASAPSQGSQGQSTSR